MHAVKWRNFKLQLIDQRYFFDDVAPSGFTMLRNLTSDPKEREPLNHTHLHTWAFGHMGRLIKEFQESVKREPLIPAGAPLDYVPRREK
jgi:arylsulfatase